MPEPRVVTPYRGISKAMGYKYRARIQTRVRRYGFLWLKKGPCYRYVLEYHNMAWCDADLGPWRLNKSEARKDGKEALDKIESPPAGEYITANQD